MPSPTQNRMAYERYITSAAWRRLRQEVFVRDDFRCQKCGSGGKLNAHHLTYERLFVERLEDLVTWCEACHKTHHDDIKAAKLRRKQKRQQEQGITKIAAVPGVCRTCGTEMEKPYWAPGGGFYCSLACKRTSIVFNRVRTNSRG